MIQIATMRRWRIADEYLVNVVHHLHYEFGLLPEVFQMVGLLQTLSSFRLVLT